MYRNTLTKTLVNNNNNVQQIGVNQQDIEDNQALDVEQQGQIDTNIININTNYNNIKICNL